MMPKCENVPFECIPKILSCSMVEIKNEYSMISKSFISLIKKSMKFLPTILDCGAHTNDPSKCCDLGDMVNKR